MQPPNTNDDARSLLENGEVALADVEEEIAALEASSLGITSFVEISFSQKENLPISRKNSLGEYVFFGATAMLFISSLVILFAERTAVNRPC